jgi:hypothetical protein
MTSVENIYLLAAGILFMLRLPLGYFLMRKEYAETEVEDFRQLIILLFYWWTDVGKKNKNFAHLLNMMLVLPILMLLVFILIHVLFC